MALIYQERILDLGTHGLLTLTQDLGTYLPLPAQKHGHARWHAPDGRVHDRLALCMARRGAGGRAGSRCAGCDRFAWQVPCRPVKRTGLGRRADRRGFHGGAHQVAALDGGLVLLIFGARWASASSAWSTWRRAGCWRRDRRRAVRPPGGQAPGAGTRPSTPSCTAAAGRGWACGWAGAGTAVPCAMGGSSAPCRAGCSTHSGALRLTPSRLVRQRLRDPGDPGLQRQPTRRPAPVRREVTRTRVWAASSCKAHCRPTAACWTTPVAWWRCWTAGP
jgi:hypothetical protein